MIGGQYQDPQQKLRRQGHRTRGQEGIQSSHCQEDEEGRAQEEGRLEEEGCGQKIDIYKDVHHQEEDNFKEDNFKEDNFKEDNFKEGNFKEGNFKEGNFKEGHDAKANEQEEGRCQEVDHQEGCIKEKGHG
jgi:hypothetical protein